MGSFKRERDLYALQLLFYHLIHPFMVRNNWSTQPKIYKDSINVIKWFTLVIAICHLLI